MIYLEEGKDKLIGGDTELRRLISEKLARQSHFVIPNAIYWQLNLIRVLLRKDIHRSRSNVRILT